MADRNKQTFEHFSDFHTGFVAHPDNKQLVRNINEASINRSIRNLIMTNRYERPFSPRLGSGLRNYLFEPMSPQTEGAIRSAVRDTIESFEPRAKIIDVLASSIVDKNTYVITIIYSLLSNPNPITLTVPLTRIR